MGIPDYQTLMRPMLEVIGDGQVWPIRTVILQLADHFQLSDEERSQLQPGRGNRLFDNRAHWARKYLKEAGLVAAPARGQLQITERGSQTLKTGPERLTERYLKQFPEFLAFDSGGPAAPNAEDAVQTANDDGDGSTPEELIARGYSILRSTLASELLDSVKGQSPTFFEHLVVELLQKMGYGMPGGKSGKVTQPTGDEGIDGLIYEDRLGLDVVYIQAKKWENTVGRPEIQKFVGALHGQRAKKGVFITTSAFSREAIDYAATIDPRIVLIDGQKLADFMIDFDVGVTTADTFTVKQVDSDFFADS